MPRLVRFDVVRDQSGGWRGEQGRGNTIVRTNTKAEAVRKTIQMAKRQEASSVRIHGRNGRIQEERTYPRGADPTRSKG
jgi:uncharacterized protein DUF2188